MFKEVAHRKPVVMGKGKEDIDFNIVSSVFGKSDNKVVDWINKGYATYINKEKALDYLHHSAPIAEALSNSRLNSATKIVENFENPTLEEEGSCFSGGRNVLDKTKALDWLGLVPPKGTASLTKQELAIANVIENFENPTLEDGEIVLAVESLADELNVPVRIVRNVDEIEEEHRRAF